MDLPDDRWMEFVGVHEQSLGDRLQQSLRRTFRSIWFVGGSGLCAECLRLGLADEVRYSILPILIGEGIRFFERLDRDVSLHLAEVKAHRNGTVELRHEVSR